MDAPEETTEVVTEVAEEVAEVSRGLSGRSFSLVLGGFVVGAAAGGALGYIFTRRKLETQYNEFAAQEIADMRDHFNSRVTALENSKEKGSLEEIVRERGYKPEPEETSRPPMAVTPPTAVVERAEEIKEDEVETPPTPEEEPEPVVRNIFRDNPPPEDDWDWHKERSRRSPMKPYVIHRDEREDQEAYEGVTYTYYTEDDVVCNERDEVMPEEDRDRVIGEANLEKFGHGSGDATIVYVRNDQLEMDMEIIRSPNSYAEEVHGFEPEIRHSHRRRGRASDDDE